MGTPSDRQLVSALLDATTNLSLRERQRATGVSHATFRRFQEGHGAATGWRELQKETRARITRYLERVGKLPPAIPPEPLTDPERARLIELWEEIGRILHATARSG